MPTISEFIGLPEIVGIAVIVSLFFHFNPATFGRPIPGRHGGEFFVWLARGFDVGRLPKGPGTWGSMVGVVWFAILLSTRRLELYCLGMVVAIVASVWICEHAEKVLNEHDPSSVVLDEIVALPVCFFPWVPHLWMPAHSLPLVADFFSGKAWLGVFAIFALFRLFDIWKPGPIGKIQKLPGGLGVVADDILAGIATALLVAIFLLLRGG